MSHLTSWVKDHTRVFLGLDWLSEAKDIAERARKQREEDEAEAGRDPHDFARWLQNPSPYRRAIPEDNRWADQ